MIVNRARSPKQIKSLQEIPKVQNKKINQTLENLVVSKRPTSSQLLQKIKGKNLVGNQRSLIIKNNFKTNIETKPNPSKDILKTNKSLKQINPTSVMKRMREKCQNKVDETKEHKNIYIQLQLKQNLLFNLEKKKLSEHS
jgi:hypothetical protein